MARHPRASPTLALFLLAFLMAASPSARAQCPPAVLLEEDFESGMPGWSLSGNWVIENDLNCGPSCAVNLRAQLRATGNPAVCRCAAYHQQNVPCSGELVAPLVLLPELLPGESLVLDFCLGYWIDGGCTLGMDDCNRLEIASATKFRAFPFHKQGGIASSCPGPQTAPPYDLSEFAGERVRISWTPGCVDGEGVSDITVDNVRVLHLSGPPSSYCLTSPNSVGGGALMGWSGTTSLSANDLVLSVSGAPPAQLGIFIAGDGSAQVPFGDGWRCVGGGVERLLPPVVTAADGSASYAVDFGAPPLAAKYAAGETGYFQLWYRDPAAGGAGFNLSNGLQAQLCP